MIPTFLTGFPIVLACGLVTGGAGFLLLRLLGLRSHLSPGASCAHALLLGLGFLSLLTQALAFASALRFFWIGGGLVLLLSGLGFPDLLRALRSLLSRAPSRTETETAALFFLLLVLALAVIPLAHLPPTNFDTLVYHLALPSLYAQRGGLVETPWLHFGYFPLQPQMAFLAGLLAGGAVWAGALSYLMGAAAVGGAMLLGRWAAGPEASGRGAGPAGAGLLLAVLPTFLFAWTLCLADAFLVAAVLLGLHALLLFREQGTRGLAILGGIHLGVALGAKYTAIGIVALVFAGAFLHDRRPRERGAIAGFLLAGAIALALLLPWAARNAAWTGNPFYPLARSAFPGGSFNEEDAERLSLETGRPAGPGMLLPDAVLVPWRLLTAPEPFGHLAGFGPPLLLLGAAAAAALFRGPGRPRTLGALFWALALLWFLSARNARFLLPALGIGAALGGEALAALRARGRHRGAIGAGILAAAAVVAMAIFAGMEQRYFRPIGFLTGRESPDAYVSGRFPPWAVYRHASETLPPGARVLLIGETRGFGLDRDFVAAAAIETSPWTRAFEAAAIRPGGAERNLPEVLREWGITHAIVNLPEGRRLEAQYSHFRSLGARWESALRALGPVRVLREDPAAGVLLLELGPPGSGDGPGAPQAPLPGAGTRSGP